MQVGAGDGAEWPLESQHAETEEEVEELQDGDGLYGAVEIFGGKVPKDFGPEEAFDSGGDLISCGRHHNEACPVVLDESAHDCLLSFKTAIIDFPTRSKKDDVRFDYSGNRHEMNCN